MTRLYALSAVALVSLFFGGLALITAFHAGQSSRDAYWIGKMSDEIEHQINVVESVRKEAESRAAALEARAKEREKELTDYETQLANRTDGACTLDADDARRLSDIIR